MITLSTAMFLMWQSQAASASKKIKQGFIVNKQLKIFLYQITYRQLFNLIRNFSKTKEIIKMENSSTLLKIIFLL